MTMQCLKYPQVQGLGVVCQPEKTEKLEGFGPSEAGIVSTMSRPVRAGDPSGRTKFSGASWG